jgi:EAL domain-containing protein (putative c-di-GMP-specific phosphodiesterase class I)
LKLHYQPVIDIKSGRLIGAETLLRLVDGNADAVGPASFIPVTEAAGLIGELGEWVAAEACRQYEIWLSQRLKIRIAINVSPLQFRQREFAEKLSCIIADTGMGLADLEIEVTESTLMESVDDAVELLNRIK